MSEGILVTILGAVAGLVTAIVTSFLIPFFQKKQERIEQKRSIHERYAQPLAADAVNLLWRLHEILIEQRAYYLREEAPPTAFNVYKVCSTCYRIAAILGWIRAIRREQSYLLFGDQPIFDQVRAAVVLFETALADSPPVEFRTVTRLAEIWQIALPDDAERVRRLAAQISAEFQHALAELGIGRGDQLRLIDGSRQGDVLRRLADTACQMLCRDPLRQEVLVDRRDEAVQAIAVKQAWIYRDWQQAIGNLLIQTIDGAQRRFDVIGFEEFDPLFADGQHAVLTRLRELIVGIDVAGADPNDYRIEQIRRLAHAIGKLVCALESIDLERRILDPAACALARRFVAEFAETPIR